MSEIEGENKYCLANASCKSRSFFRTIKYRCVSASFHDHDCVSTIVFSYALVAVVSKTRIANGKIELKDEPQLHNSSTSLGAAWSIFYLLSFQFILKLTRQMFRRSH